MTKTRQAQRKAVQRRKNAPARAAGPRTQGPRAQAAAVRTIPTPTPDAQALPSDDPLAEPVPVVGAYAPPEPVRQGSRARRQPRVRTVTYPPLTRVQEYAYIRADLRRLLYTAGPLLVVMLALLFVIER